MKTLLVMPLLFLLFGYTNGQSFKSSESEIVFFSSAPLEDIKATNVKGTGLFNAGTGAIAFVVPIKGFQFRKSLMQQHFNENYMESGKYPQATFEGRLKGYNPQMAGSQEVLAEGRMTIHGVTNNISIKGQLTKLDRNIEMQSKFWIKVADYDIDIPRVVFYNIAEEVEVTVMFRFQEF